MHPKLAAATAAIPPPAADSDQDALRVAVARGLIAGYHHRWLDDRWTVEAVEEEFHVPIFNPDTRRRSPCFDHAGKFDGIVRRGDERFLLEHKTCAEDVSPGSWYWKRLTIDTQISGYLLASWHLGRRLTGVLYDVIRKPEIRPKKLALKETSEVRASGRYFDRPLSPASYQRFSLDHERRETPEMFEARLAADAIARLDWYFGRQVITRLDQELLIYAHELWQTNREIHQAEKARDVRRNDRACFAFNRPCEYLDLCAGHDTIDNPRWKKLDIIHPELEDPTCGPRTLTHSRIATFCTCRRKHWYRYTLGLSRWDTPEPLAFGTLLHQALAAWWATDAAADDGDAV